MNIIEVIPIVKGFQAETLSYFSPETLPLGAVVSVPLRKKTVQGIVTKVQSAQDMKGDIKQAAFILKKITIHKGKNANTDSGESKGNGGNKGSKNRKNRQFFLKEFMETAHLAAKYYASSTGAILANLVPDSILSKTSALETVVTEQENTKNTTKNSHEIKAVQGDDEERYGSYRSLIRQEFAKKESVFLLLPTVEDAVRAYDLLEKGIEGYAFLFHNSLSQKKLTETWNNVIQEKHPVVIIATGSFLCIPRLDIGTIIVEKENSRGYKSQRRPYPDVRTVAEIYARKKNIPLIFGDILLRTETLWRESEGEIQQSAPFKFRSLSTAKETLVDMRQYRNADKPEDRFRVLSIELEKLIQSNKENNEHMLVLATRRGISPSVICGDCQTIVTCNNCSAPVILHKAPTPTNIRPSATPAPAPKNFFMCHRCGTRRPSEEYCKVCTSWKLSTVGIGIDLVAEKIREKFPDVLIFQIDSDTTKTEKQARAAIHEFQTHPSSILLGTEMMLLYAQKKVNNAAVISLDSLFSIPDFRIQEKILHTLLTLRSLATRELIVQTRRADEKIFEHALKGNLSDFYRSMLEERKIFSYPPYTTMIKITLEGKKEDIVAEMTSIQKSLEPQSVDIFPAFTHTVKGNYVLHGLMRLPYGRWPDNEISERLRALPPNVTVNIDPDSLL